ncbi:MAG TPA: methyltransferase domain-containing protein [Roseiflexaceae bacterium]|nr:methyltransferase domain-containing protein [Roseiflexaceae bacterium]
MKTPTYIAQTQPGFEAIAAQEIKARLKGASVRGTRTVGDKNGMVLFSYAGEVHELLALRTVEDVFVLVTSLRDLPPTFGGLREIRSAMETVALDMPVTLARRVQPGRGGRGKLRFRVIARQIGRTSYRRVDAQQAVEKAILARTDRRWQLVEDDALEFWLTLLNDEVLVALRLSDEQMRHREHEKGEHIPASLRPAAAAALVWLTQPRPNDVFLDPMCGAGTLLIERAHAGRYKLLVGGDISEEAVAVTRKNIGPRHKPIEIHDWDARRLPLDDGAVTACAVNLPFGRQISSHEENRGLYPAFLGEIERVLRPQARMVALTGDTRTFDGALRRASGFRRLETYPVQVLGQRALVYVLERV